MSVKCPRCKAKMYVISQPGNEDLFQFECVMCGYVEPEEDVEYTNDGTKGPIFLNFEGSKDFEKVMEEYSHNIHTRTISEINKAIKDKNEYVIIAYLNSRENILGIVDEEFLIHVEKSREYFEEVEDYEKCSECIKLEKKIKKLQKTKTN
jgi:hypothetical protein